MHHQKSLFARALTHFEFVKYLFMLAVLFLIKNIVLWPNVREPEAWALPFWSQSLFETTFYFHFSELGRNSNSVWRRKNNIQENLRLSICKTMSWAGNLRLLSVILTNLLCLHKWHDYDNFVTKIVLTYCKKKLF